MSNTTYTPGIGNTPFGNTNTNPEASNYGQESQFNPTEAVLIAKEIRRIIFDAAPVQYNAMKILFSKSHKEKGLDEFEYLEKTFGRSPLEAVAAVGAQAPVIGANVQQVITVTAGSLTRLSIDLVITYPNGEEGVIVDITGNQITVNSLTNSGLPAVAAADIFAVRSTIMADGMDTFSNYSRMDTIKRYNYIQFFLRAQRWNRIELQKYKNNGTTDYLDKDRQEKMRQLRTDMFVSYFNGHRGEYAIANGHVAKSMGGIYPTMVNAGSAQANPTLASLQSAFETLAFSTNFKAEGATRFIYATHEMINEFSKIYKQPSIEYRPNDMIANLHLNMIKFGGMNFVFVPCELFREESCFPADWQRRILVLDQETISPVKMKGIPALEMGQTDNLNKGSREQFTDFWCKGQLSLEFNNPLSSFILDIQ